jgi:hypothetical protein
LALRLDVPSGSEGLDALLLDDCPLWIRPSGASPSGWTAGRNAGDGDIIDPWRRHYQLEIQKIT